MNIEMMIARPDAFVALGDDENVHQLYLHAKRFLPVIECPSSAKAGYKLPATHLKSYYRQPQQQL